MRNRSYVVIEDDDEVAALLVTILREYDAGAGVQSFSYLPPLDEIADPPPRAIVLDLTLGGLPVGRAFFDDIRSCLPLVNVPVLVCTASSRDAVPFDGVSEPRVGVVTKPFSLDEFIGALRDLEERAGLIGIPLPADAAKETLQPRR